MCIRDSRIETYTPEWKPQLDRIHLQNGTYFLDERGFVPEKEDVYKRQGYGAAPH